MEERHVVTSFLEWEGKVALLRRSGKVGTYRGRWAGVSGYLEEGATPYQQALREIAEEVGLGAQDLELVKEGQPLEAVDEGLGRRWIIHPFRFRIAHPGGLRLDWEHTELRWVDPAQIGELETVPRLVDTWEQVADPAPEER